MDEDLYAITREKIKEVDELISALKLKRGDLYKALQQYRLPHYCPFCSSDSIVKSPVETSYRKDLLAEGAMSISLAGFYYCKSCGKGAKIGGMSKRKLAALKIALGVAVSRGTVHG